MSDAVRAGVSGSAEGPHRLGIFTTDAGLTITSWDAALASLTGIAPAAAIGQPLPAVAPDLERRGLLAIVANTLATGAPTVLAPALHGYFIPASPSTPSARYERMQQRVAIAPLMSEGHATGLVVTIEDVTERLELEHQLAAELRNENSAARMRAVQRLSAMTPVDGLGPLPAAMGDEDWQVRRSAVRSLAHHQHPGLIEAIVTALRDSHRDFSVLSSALQLLSLSGVDLTASLADLLRHPDADLRIQAALALGTQPGPEAVDALLTALGDENVNVRFHAIEALGKLRPSAAVERLATIAESRDFFLAFPALEALCRISDPTVAVRLVPLLQDELVGDQAAEALGQIGDDDTVAPLVAGLDRSHLSATSVVDALTALHRRYSVMFSGGAMHIEELVRTTISATAAARIIDAAARASGSSLRQFVIVLGWLRGDAVERALAHMLGTPGVQNELLEAIVRFGSPMVDRLIEQLRADDVGTRRSAAVALGRIGDVRAVMPLVQLLDDDDRALLVPATSALARLGDSRAFESLLRLIADPEVAVRQGAIGALNSIGHPDMAPRIRALLDDVDPLVRESAVKVAGYFGYASCAQALLDRCRDPDETVRAAALAHIGFLDDDRCTSMLLQAISSDTPRARAAAAQSLAHAGGPEVIDALRNGTGDVDQWVRYFSVTSLGRHADRASLPLFTRIAASDAAQQVRIAAIAAIGDIGASSEAEAVSLLAAFIDGPDDELAVAAARALGSIEAESTAAPLRRALSAPQAARRVAAADAIARCGSAAAIELLRWTAAADSDGDVMRAAIAGLSRIAVASGEYGDQAVAAIAALAGDAMRRADAIAALASLPESAIPKVGQALSCREPSVRRAVLEALGRLTHPTASTYILTALEDVDASVRQLAVTILSRLGSRGVSRSIAALASSDPSEGVRRAAEMAMRRLGRNHGEPPNPADGQ